MNSQLKIIRLRIYILSSLAITSIHAQTLTEPQPAGVDHTSMLELPPAIVIDEWTRLEEESEKVSDKQTEENKAQKKEPEGIQIQIEKTASKSGQVNRKGKVKIDAPWPAKPISVPPVGWEFAPGAADSDPFRTQVKLTNGNTVDLSITPYVLVPIADGRSAIKIPEPGYNATLEFSQKDTLGVMLENSTAEIENHEKHAADAIQRLQQLLSSLPR